MADLTPADIAALREPPNGTRVAVRLRAGHELPVPSDVEWLVIWRDDEYGRRDWVVPEGESSWFSDFFDPRGWSELAPGIAEMFYLLPASKVRVEYACGDRSAWGHQWPDEASLRQHLNKVADCPAWQRTVGDWEPLAAELDPPRGMVQPSGDGHREGEQS